MTVTIKDIARETGKSITTVSRALNDYDDVSPETKSLVRRVAAEMGYTPNLWAQRLQKQRTETVGLILPTMGPRLGDPFFGQLIAGVGDKAGEYGYDLLVSTLPPGENEVEIYKKKVQSRQLDGVIVVRTRRHDARIEYLRAADIPFVVFGRTEGELDYPYVDEDGAAGMRAIVEHLIRAGHRRIACIAPPEELMFAKYRMQGVHEALAQHGLELDPTLLRRGDLTQRGGFVEAQALLALPQPPTAIVACNDLMAFGAISAAQQQGLVVGQDIAITGFDDTPWAEHSHPPLTTVHQPIYEIGNMLCDMLIRITQGQTLEQRQIVLKPRLVIRQSCGTAAS
ncbi:MAG: LacI family transcriptional regulator [Chloroflexi bacterium]|nr:LacI family transcriptional regulator [Chloroflexota bacterium]